MLTDAQLVDVRRFAGYPLVGDTNVSADRDMAYSWVSPGIMQTLYSRIRSLSAAEELVLVQKYLPTLNTLEQAIVDSSENLDTDQAAVWFHNKNEVSQRTSLFNQKRRDMCAYIGINPGPYLGAGGVKIGRA